MQVKSVIWVWQSSIYMIDPRFVLVNHGLPFTLCIQQLLELIHSQNTDCTLEQNKDPCRFQLMSLKSSSEPYSRAVADLKPHYHLLILRQIPLPLKSPFYFLLQKTTKDPELFKYKFPFEILGFECIFLVIHKVQSHPPYLYSFPY